MDVNHEREEGRLHQSDVETHEDATEVQEIDIYSYHSHTRKVVVLYICALISFLTPFTDTVYLPALSSVSEDLHASDSEVAATVSTYLAASAVGQIIWGSLTDYTGRLPTLFGSLIMYLGLTIGCIFVTNITELLILRSLQGLSIGATVIATQAIIADIFAPDERGTAMSTFFWPLLIGPIIAPLIGGYISQIYTWRSCFVLLAIITVPVALVAYVAIPVTEHYKVVKQHHHKSNIRIQNADLLAQKPPLMWPHQAMMFLFDPEIAPYYFSAAITFAAMFSSLTLLPLRIALPPYSLDKGTIGLCFLPVGFAMLLGSQIGGRMSDSSAARLPHSPDGRMWWPQLGLWLVPISSIAYGIALDYNAHLAAVLICQSICGFGNAVLMPSTMGYLSSVRQANAGSATSVMMFVCFGSAAISISVAVPIVDEISFKYFWLILALLNLCSAIWTTAISYYRIFVLNNPATQVKETAGSNNEISMTALSQDDLAIET